MLQLGEERTRLCHTKLCGGAKLHDRVCSCRLKPCVCAASRWENVVVVVALLLEKVEVAREEA